MHRLRLLFRALHHQYLTDDGRQQYLLAVRGGLPAVMGPLEFVVELGIVWLGFQQPGPVEPGGAGIVVGFKERRLDLTADAGGGGSESGPRTKDT
jgi:hypothetical protein